MDNHFLREDTSYVRDLDVVSGYYHDAAKYLQLNTKRPFEECLAYVRKTTQPGAAQGMRDPKSLVLKKDKNGDRYPDATSFMGFLQKVKQDDLLLSPSMAAYVRENVDVSRHSQYIEEGVKDRKVVKKAMNEANARGDFETAMIKNGEQQNLKINNNSYSGATVSLATILYYRSTHSSLTSTCRTATSYANATNEKFLAGNRHYYTPEITKSNIVSLINLSDVAAIDECCQTFGLVYPDVDQFMQCVQYSTDPYWGGLGHLATIRKMAENMTPAERATVVYAADMYHLHLFNKEVVEKFLLQLSTPCHDPKYHLSDEVYDGLDGDVKLLADFLCFDIVKARTRDELVKEDPQVWETVKATAHHCLATVKEYKQLVKALWLGDIVPSSIHAFPSAYRRTAVISDTDSTMFTLQYWIEQIYGYISFSTQAKRVVFGIVFLVSELMLHVLAIQSANMGVSLSKIRLLAMKNEFYFAVLSMTTRSKHYYASQDAQEGVMFAKAKLEVKGVGLRDSKVPKKINDRAKEMMTEIIDTIKAEQPLSIRDILTEIADIERDIIKSVESGSFEYMTTGQIKAADSYKQGESAPAYQQYLMWKQVFEPTLGKTQEPPYSVVKVSLKAGNRTEIKEWCDRMDNPALADRLQVWMEQVKRSDLSTLQLPFPVVETSGIPKEIIAGIDIRKMVFNTMGTFYLMLESLGVFMQDKRITRLVSDYH